MKRLLLLLLVIAALTGCDKPLAPAPKLDLVPIAEAIAVQAEMIIEDAEIIEQMAFNSKQPEGMTVVVKAQGIQRSAEAILDKAAEVKDGQKVVDKQAATIVEQAEQIEDLKTGTGKAWQWLALAGGVGLVAALVILYLGSKLMAGAVAVGSVGAILVGWLAPVVMAVAQWVFIGLAVVAAGIVAWYVYINRKALVQVVKGVEQTKPFIDPLKFGEAMDKVQTPATVAIVKALRPPKRPPEPPAQ